MEIKINILELASELAHKELIGWVSNESELYEEPEAGITNYTDYYQDIFNDLYDKYYSIIESCADLK
jgi:hypothetical protein